MRKKEFIHVIKARV